MIHKKYFTCIILFLIFISCTTKNNGETMNNFFSFFSNKNKTISFDNILSQVSKYSKPTYHLIKSEKKSFSKIGGLPNIPKDFNWPTWNEKPLSFIAQLKMSEINIDGYLSDFPKEGLIYIFYDKDQSTWGFDPKDKGSWRMYFIKNENILLDESSMPSGLDKECVYKEKYIIGKQIKTYPSSMNQKFENIKLTDDLFEQYYDYIHSLFNNQSQHIIGGYPNPQQGDDMDLECQLVSNGIYLGDSNGFNSKEAKELGLNRNDWILFLQVDSDDETGMMWGDVGMLYFWIKKDDLNKLNFDDVWMILQCG